MSTSVLQSEFITKYPYLNYSNNSEADNPNKEVNSNSLLSNSSSTYIPLSDSPCIVNSSPKSPVCISPTKSYSSSTGNWMYQCNKGWRFYPTIDNLEIEKSYQDGSPSIELYPYRIDFLRFIQVNMNTGKVRSIIRDGIKPKNICTIKGKDDFDEIKTRIYQLNSNNKVGYLTNTLNNEDSFSSLLVEPIFSSIANGTFDFLNNIMKSINFGNSTDSESDCIEDGDSTNNTEYDGSGSVYLSANSLTGISNYQIPIKYKDKISINSPNRINTSTPLILTPCNSPNTGSAIVTPTNTNNQLFGKPICSYTTKNNYIPCTPRHKQNLLIQSPCNSIFPSKYSSVVPLNGQDVTTNRSPVRISPLMNLSPISNDFTKALFSSVNLSPSPSIQSPDKIEDYSKLKYMSPPKLFSNTQISKSKLDYSKSFLGGNLEVDNKPENFEILNSFQPYKYRRTVGIVSSKSFLTKSCSTNDKKLVRFNKLSPIVKESCDKFMNLGDVISLPNETDMYSIKEQCDKPEVQFSNEDKSIPGLDITDIEDLFSPKLPEINKDSDFPEYDDKYSNVEGINHYNDLYDHPTSDDDFSSGLSLNFPLSHISYMDEDLLSMDYELNKKKSISKYLGSIQPNIFNENYHSFSPSNNLGTTDPNLSRVIDLRNINPSNGVPYEIIWWSNHSIKSLFVQLDCDIGYSLPFQAPIELLPLLHPLLKGYMDTPSNLSQIKNETNEPCSVLMGLKNLEIKFLKPSIGEYSKISDFCYKELKNVTPTILDQFEISQSVLPISIFSLLLTRFPVPAANTFLFSFICNDDSYPHSGMQTIQILSFQLQKKTCMNSKYLTNSWNKDKVGNLNDSSCSHIHLDSHRSNSLKVCPWLAISNIIDEFILRTPIVVKCVLDHCNIMIIPSNVYCNYKSTKNNEFKEYDFVILTLNLLIPLLIIHSQCLQNIVIGDNKPFSKDNSDLFININTKIRIDAMILSCRYLPCTFPSIRNIDLVLDLNLDNTNIGSTLLSKKNILYSNSLSITSDEEIPTNQKDNLHNNNLPENDISIFEPYHENFISELNNLVREWMNEFIEWFDKYVGDSIEYIEITLYLSLRCIEGNIQDYFILQNRNLHETNVKIDLLMGNSDDISTHFEQISQDFANNIKECRNNIKNSNLSILISPILANLLLDITISNSFSRLSTPKS
ncbi:WWE domain-containing protein [Cryptosporidium muris RN66]|uniref:WWE domain-containing protein n=1 Tax=Cryptosporidium muris (strain RN66) TaxID=441375 RepID=B6AC86_CRYMR|nr:WWE domain-containing protein [Cryptosporidium muris RN66]EEA06142.1 WWE domain-containing protein [Cryptosporidium muris RN66]|eukprot:XP_002140491.1 WWE domain-containing protein [Cryptosporidium muris RN66]